MDMNNPNNSDYWKNKGDIFLHKGKYGEALKCYNKVFELEPHYPTTAKNWKDRGDYFYNSGNYEEALQCYTRTLEIDPAFSTIANIACMLRILNKPEDALKLCNVHLKINPDDAHILSIKGLIFGDQKKYKEAMKCYNKILKVDPSKSSNWCRLLAWHQKGNILLYNRNKYIESIKCFDRALEINSKYYEALSSKGKALYELGKYDEAIKCFNTSLWIEPADFYTWTLKGLALSRLENYNEAITCFDKALEIKPGYLYALECKADVIAVSSQPVHN